MLTNCYTDGNTITGVSWEIVVSLPFCNRDTGVCR